MSTPPLPSPIQVPTPMECYERGWKLAAPHAGVLIVILLIAVGAQIPSSLLDVAVREELVPWWASVFSSLWSFLVVYPIYAGLWWACIRVARGETPEVGDAFAGFRRYLPVVGVSFLTTVIIGAGCCLLLVPGIILACRLAFAQALVMDRGVGPIEALTESWRLTENHGVDVFLVYLIAVPLMIAGLLALCVGVFVAVLWLFLAMAVLYAWCLAAAPPAVSLDRPMP